MNCSGKHTGMLLACQAAGWPTDGYWEPSHPLQIVIRNAVEDLTGEEVAAVGVDGCGAPVLTVSLTGLARAFLRLVSAAPGSVAVGVPGAGAVALKIDDGARRARMPVLVSALRRLGMDAPVLDELAELPLLGGGARVGAVTAVWA